MARAPRESRKAAQPVFKLKPTQPVAGSSSGKQSTWSSLGVLALWALILVTPLIFNPLLTDNFRLPKLMFSEVAALLSVAFLVTRFPRRPLQEWLRLPFVQLLGATLVVVALSALASEHSSRVVAVLPSFGIGLVALVVWAVCLTDRERRALLTGLTAMGTLVAFLGILQYHEIASPFDFQGQVSDRLAMTSLAGGAFDLAGYLLLPILLVQAHLAQAKTRGRRVLVGSALVVMLYALALSQTLTVVLAVLVGLALFWWLYLGPKVAWPYLAGLVAVGLLAVAIITPLRSRVLAVAEDLGAGRFNEMLSGRLDGWKAAGWMFQQNPLLGVGPGAYRSEFGDAKLALVEGGSEFFAYHRSSYFVNAHNDCLELAAELGFPGFALLLWASWLLVQRLRAKWAQEPQGIASSMAIAGVVGWALLSLGNFPWHVALMAYPALLWLSGIFGEPGEGNAPEAAPSVHPRWIWALCALLVLGAVLRGHHWLQVSRARAAAIAAERTVNSALSQGVSHLPARILLDSLGVLERSLEVEPSNIESQVTLAGHLFLMRRFEAAEQAYLRAAELEQRAEIYANLVRVALALGDAERATGYAKKAMRLDVQLKEPLLDILRQHAERTAPRPVSTGAIFQDSFEDGHARAWSGLKLGKGAVDAVES